MKSVHFSESFPMNFLNIIFVSSLIFNNLTVTPAGDIETVYNSYLPEEAAVVQPAERLYTVEPLHADWEQVHKFRFTDESILSAQRFTVDKLVSDFISPAALDGTREQYLLYLSSRTGYSEEVMQSVTPSPVPGENFTPIIPLTTPGLNLPNVTKNTNSLPAVNNTKIVLEEVAGSEFNKKPRLVFSYSYVAEYKVSDTNVLDFVSLQPGVGRVNAENLVADKVLEWGGFNLFTVTGQVQFTVEQRDNGWVVVDLDTNYQYDVSDFLR